MSLDIGLEVVVPNTALFKGDHAHIVQAQLAADTEFAVNAIQGAVMPLSPINNGFLRNAWGTRVALAGAQYDVLGRVFNPLDYALPQERGARPHWPPPEPIQAWVRRKLGVSEKQVRSVAFLIARKISRVGMKGQAMAYRAVEQVTPMVQARFREGLASIVRRLGQ